MNGTRRTWLDNQSFDTEDAREGVAAFLERRGPHVVGR
jgi:hypothetical protein